jgi:polysaccharide pyruvyl transferase WcaK-like protein
MQQTSKKFAEERPLVYLCGAGGKGNLGAEAIMLAIMKICIQRIPDVTFAVASWHGERMEKILDEASISYDRIIKESVFSSFSTPKNMKCWMICGDVALTESVVPVLPLYYGIRTFLLRLKKQPGVFLGIESEKPKKFWNKFAIKTLIDRSNVYLIQRNRNSLDSLTMHAAASFLGCDPTLMLNPEDFSSFALPESLISCKKPLVGFAVRDFFSNPLRLTVQGKLVRTDVPLGSLSDEMNQIIKQTAALADFLVETYDAQPVFMPHHFLHSGEQVIMPDSLVAEEVIKHMKHPESAVILPDDLHPFCMINFYGKLQLLVSMRHHANCFALLHQVPTLCYAISEKLVRFFRELECEENLYAPLSEPLATAEARIQYLLGNRETHQFHLRDKLAIQRRIMGDALDETFRKVFPTQKSNP